MELNNALGERISPPLKHNFSVSPSFGLRPANPGDTPPKNYVFWQPLLTSPVGQKFNVLNFKLSGNTEKDTK